MNSSSRPKSNIAQIILAFCAVCTVLITYSKYTKSNDKNLTELNEKNNHSDSEIYGYSNEHSISKDENNDIITIFPSNSYEYEYNQYPINKIKGDYNGDGREEFAIIYRDSQRLEDSTHREGYETYGGNCLIYITKNNIDMINIDYCGYLHIENKGDLDDIPGDELLVEVRPEAGTWGRIEVYTFYPNVKQLISTSIWDGSPVDQRIIKEDTGYFKVISDEGSVRHEVIVSN